MSLTDGMIGENANLHIELDGSGNDTDTPYKLSDHLRTSQLIKTVVWMHRGVDSLHKLYRGRLLVLKT